MTFSTALLILTTLVYGAVATVNWLPMHYKNCKSGFDIISVETDQCPGGKKFCAFQRGTRPQIRIGFIPISDRNVDQLHAQLRAKVAGITTPYPMEQENACENSNLTCPLQAGQTYYYSQSIHVLQNYPKLDVQVNWLLNDPSNDEKANEQKKKVREVCIIFLAKTMDRADMVQQRLVDSF